MKIRATWTAAMAIAALLTLALGAAPGPGGGAPYTPTQAEWLCVLLNMDEAAAADLTFAQGTGVRYSHDRSRPDTIEIEVLYNVNVGAAERRHRAQHAEQQAREMAQRRGWDGWLKTRLKETKIAVRMPEVKPLEK